jgi:uncharacterized repeat protein (TIGR04076 family)
MFKVKATVVNFLGNTKIYPCHMGHKIGDEVIFDGESYNGRLCPDVWPLIVPKVAALHQAGPRYIEWVSYYPFWYCSPSENDPGQKKYDGLGFKNVLKTIVPPQFDMANLAPHNAFKWPPHRTRNVSQKPSVICPDSRTSMVVRLEAFDLSDKGFNIPYFRRQMAILSKLQCGGEIAAEKILKTFSKKQIEEVYPPLNSIMVQMLAEELELMGYIETRESSVAITEKGQEKLRNFVASLPEEDRKVFAQYNRET